jgi:hypothetical protein
VGTCTVLLYYLNHTQHCCCCNTFKGRITTGGTLIVEIERQQCVSSWEGAVAGQGGTCPGRSAQAAFSRMLRPTQRCNVSITLVEILANDDQDSGGLIRNQRIAHREPVLSKVRHHEVGKVYIFRIDRENGKMPHWGAKVTPHKTLTCQQWRPTDPHAHMDT